MPIHPRNHNRKPIVPPPQPPAPTAAGNSPPPPLPPAVKPAASRAHSAANSAADSAKRPAININTKLPASPPKAVPRAGSAKTLPGAKIPSAPSRGAGVQVAATVAPAVPQAEELTSTAHDTPTKEVLLRNTPPWLVSLVVHMVLLLAAALINIPVLRPDILNLDLSYTQATGNQLESFELASFDSLTNDSEMSLDALPTVDPLAALPELDIDLTGMTLTSEIDAPNIGLALTGRSEGAKEGLLAAYGGTGATEGAVQLGLEWLKRHQQRDGSWSLDGPYSDGGRDPNRTAATAMALLAFQGAGHTHQSGAYQKVVERGMAALLKLQDKDGNFFQKGPNHHRMYSQAQATIAICELYGMTQDEKLREPAMLAIDYLARTQGSNGGWRYSPRDEGDTSVTGWVVMALQSARMAGLDVPSTTLENISVFLDTVQVDDGSTYSYQPDTRPRISMTAEALLCRQYLGWQRNDPRLLRGAEEILAVPIDWDRPNVYYWYYATQVMHHLGGEQWFAWNQVMRQAIPAHQVTTAGKERGSWDPSGDPHDVEAGRLYTTCLCLYMLEVYYRHLPIYQHPR